MRAAWRVAVSRRCVFSGQGSLSRLGDHMWWWAYYLAGGRRAVLFRYSRHGDEGDEIGGRWRYHFGRVDLHAAPLHSAFQAWGQAHCCGREKQSYTTCVVKPQRGIEGLATVSWTSLSSFSSSPSVRVRAKLWAWIRGGPLSAACLAMKGGRAKWLNDLGEGTDRWF